jgi:hypothetical protein
VFTQPLHQRFNIRLCLNLAAIGFLLALSPAAIADEFSTVRVGYQNRAQVGRWMPVHVNGIGFEAGQELSLVVRSVDARGNATLEVCDSTTADQAGAVDLNGLVRTGRLDTPLIIQIVNADQTEVLCQTTVQCRESRASDSGDIQTSLQLFRQDVRFLLTIDHLAGVDELVDRMATASPESPGVVGAALESVDEFPDTLAALEMFSTVVISGAVSFNPGQLTALRAWASGGGHLIVSCSDEVGTLLESDFGRWLDSHFQLANETKKVTDADLGAMQQLLPRSTRISTLMWDVQMSQIGSDQITSLAESANGSLVARASVGAGRITFVAVNLGRKPLSRWTSLPDFYGMLILGQDFNQTNAPQRSSRISSSGVTDLSTQLMATVDPVPTTGRWAVWSVMGITFLWLLLAGPVDYLLVVVLLKRPYLTWLTFPTWVVLAFVGLHSLKPQVSEPVLNSVHLLDVTQDAGLHRVSNRSMLSLSVPDTSQRDLLARVNDSVTQSGAPVHLSWLGRAENVYGGMYRTTGIGGISAEYQHLFDKPAHLQSIPFLVDGSFEMEAVWSASSATPLVESDLNVSGFGLINGSITHHLDVPVRDWVVAFGNRLYRPKGPVQDNWTAGESWSFERGTSHVTDLKSWLTSPRNRTRSGSGREPSAYGAAVPYNRDGRDPLDIVMVMSLYELAGAEAYTGLTHHPLHLLDVSTSVRTNYALLIGAVDIDTVHIELDGNMVTPASSTGIVRILFPVDRRPAKPAAMTQDEINAARAQENSVPTDSNN